MKILIVVDVQNDFCPGGALAVSEGDQVVEPINDLLLRGGYDLLVATQDWHPAEHRSFAANNPGRQLYDQIELAGRPQILWPVHCQQHTPGAELHPRLRREIFDRIVRKGTNPNVDSYSGFFENDHRTATGLHEYIMDQAARQSHLGPAEIELHVCGLALDYCVKYSALDAAKLGYQVAVVRDACRAVNLQPGDDLRSLAEIEAAGARVVQARDVLHGREPRGRERGVDLQP